MNNLNTSKSNRALLKEGMEVALATLREKIQNERINTFTTKTRKILGSNWSYLPNCGKFEIKVYEENNPPLAMAGIEKHIDPTVKIEALSLRISKANKFMRNQIRRLKKDAAENPQRFWRTAWYLMERSNSFRVSAWNHVFPKWHRDQPLWRVIQTNKKLSKIITERSSKMNFKRVYIPKPPADWRPLGVPTPEWRLYTFMLGAMLGIQFLPTLLPTQHGFRPNMGSLSAWKALVKEKVLDADYIYEIDLQQYFPSIKLRPIITALYQSGMPAEIIRHIEDLCRQQPKLPEESLRKLDETNIVRQHSELAELYKRYPPSVLSILTEISFCQTDPSFASTLPPGSRGLHIQVDQTLDDMYSGNYDPISHGPKYDVYSYEIETNQIYQALYDEGIYNPSPGDLDRKKFEMISPSVLDFRPDRPDIEKEFEEFGENLEGEELSNHETGDELAKWDSVLQWGGLPQGSGISPILTSLPLKEFYGQHPSVSYADDGLFYWSTLSEEEERKHIMDSKESIIAESSEDNPILNKIFLGDPRRQIKDNKEDGIVIHPSPKKSKFVKYRGVWLCPIVFLGLEYNGINDSFRAHTRKGATLELPASMKDDLTVAWQVISEDIAKEDPNYKGYQKVPHPNLDPEPPLSFEEYLRQEELKELKFIKTQKAGRNLILEDQNPDLEDIRLQVRNLPELTGRTPEVRFRQSKERWKQSLENYKHLVDHDKTYLSINYLEDEANNPYRSWAELFGSKLIGIIQARLYSNDFSLKLLEQDFAYTFSRGSWASQHYGIIDKPKDRKDRLNVFTSSSAATMSLLHMLDEFQIRAYGPSGGPEPLYRPPTWTSPDDTTDFKKKQFEDFIVYYR